MEKVSKESVLQNLDIEWKEFIIRYGSLPPESKDAYLQQQGFARLSDFLSHILAWWMEADVILRAVRKDPAFTSPKYDVDAFNAEAIRKNRGKDEKQIIDWFEKERKELFQLVSSLEDAQMENQEVQNALYWMIKNHYAEHKF